MFLNLRLTVGEDLLPLSVQKSSNLCVFKVLFLTCFNNGLLRSIMAFCHCFNNGLPRSLGHGRRRLTNRQAFSLGVIDMFSVCVFKHLLEMPIDFQSSGHKLCGLDVSCFLVNFLPDHIYPSGGFSFNRVN